MKLNWRIPDLIDLEFFLATDDDEDHGDDAHRRARDREIFKTYIEPRLDKTPADRSEIIRHWLEYRRSTPPRTVSVLPGVALQKSAQLIVAILVVAGFALGSGAALALLNYTGQSPVNISAYMFFFVFVQIGLLAITLLLLLFNRFRNGSDRRGLILNWLALLITKMTNRVKEAASDHWSAAARNRYHAALGVFRGKHHAYGAVFFWLLFTAIQGFGVMLNLGIVTATLLRVVGADLAFGWQSTLRIGSQAVYRLIELVAAPWRWLLPAGIAHPTADQIEGSRMVLKDGIYRLATEDLVSWWPFLLMAVLVYGFLPRLTLLAVGLAARNRAAATVGFRTAACDDLIYRLTTPAVSTTGLPVTEEKRPIPTVPWIPPAGVAEADDNPLPPESAVVLVPGDLENDCPREELLARVFRKTGLSAGRVRRYGTDARENRHILDTLAGARWEDGRPNLIILQEAWQAPINETLMFIRRTKQILGNAAAVKIALIGKPSRDTIFTEVASEHRSVWAQSVQQLSDPTISVFALGGRYDR